MKRSELEHLIRAGRDTDLSPDLRKLVKARMARDFR
jgi:hypothetical protein